MCFALTETSLKKRRLRLLLLLSLKKVRIYNMEKIFLQIITTPSLVDIAAVKMSVLTAQHQKKTTKMAGIPTEETFKKEQKEVAKVATILKVSATPLYAQALPMIILLRMYL